jgi:hypothetical protein
MSPSRAHSNNAGKAKREGAQSWHRLNKNALCTCGHYVSLHEGGNECMAPSCTCDRARVRG